MGDLISRSALIKVLKDRATNESIMGYMTAYDVTNSIIDEVEEQPTAYDIDKVVEELKQRSKEYNSGVRLHGKSEEMLTDDAIEIVKQGGVSDVCEWKAGKSNDDWKPSCEPNATYNVFGVAWFRKCPYCGKKIKVVE